MFHMKHFFVHLFVLFLTLKFYSANSDKGNDWYMIYFVIEVINKFYDVIIKNSYRFITI